MMKPRPFRRTFIRAWRKHRGLTLEQLASRVHLTPSALSMLERGKRGYSQASLELLADALNTDPASLLMRDPSNEEAIWSIWDNASPAERQTLVNIANAIKPTGTDN